MAAELLTTLAGTVLLLGVRHGFDADHLAAIDGLTRYNSSERSALARHTGVLFALGHGAVVLIAAVLVATFAHDWQAPGWLRSTGAWSSAAVLIALSTLNIVGLLRLPAHAPARLAGWRTTLFAPLMRARRPWAVAAVGGLFALSFDTLGIAALVGLSGFQQSSAQYGAAVAMLLALAFTLGMMVTDGVNGYWINRLIERAGAAGLRASRIFGLVICATTIITAGFGIAAQVLPETHWLNATRPVSLSVAIIVAIAASYAAVMWPVRATLSFTRAAR